MKVAIDLLSRSKVTLLAFGSLFVSLSLHAMSLLKLCQLSHLTHKYKYLQRLASLLVVARIAQIGVP